jgi:hypothetical protein
MSSIIHASRAALLLLALLSAVVLGDAQKSRCAMHGGLEVSAGTGMTQDDAASHDRMGAGDSGMHSGGSPDRRDTDHCHCSCIGDCSVSAPIATIPTLPTIRVAVVVADSPPAFPARTSDTPRESADRRLPFANGPPATRLS